MLRPLSIGAFVLMIAGLSGLLYTRALLADRPILIALQIAAFMLMVAARVAFGRRSFHAAADPTEGGLVTTGPYAYVRHPIYAAILYFVWAGIASHPSWQAAGFAALVTLGAVARMLSEERLLIARYPAYAEYRKRVKRVVPFVL